MFPMKKVYLQYQYVDDHLLEEHDVYALNK